MVRPVETKKSWCGRGDLNPHAFRRHPLKMVCLPVPALPHINNCRISNHLQLQLQALAIFSVCVFVCALCNIPFPQFFHCESSDPFTPTALASFSDSD